ncbi:MAG: MAPEG family protein [Rhizobium sp.]|nr:MAPEG family protein [Rhizobium sp.]
MQQSTAIFWPVFVQVALIYLVYYLLFSRRQAEVKAGRARLSQFRDNAAEPDETRALKNNLTNQYELPVLFMVGCLASYATGNADLLAVLLAWLFVALRIVHAVIHIGQNRLRHRVPVFIAGYVVNGLLWLWLAINIAIV